MDNGIKEIKPIKTAYGEFQQGEKPGMQTLSFLNYLIKLSTALT